MVFGGAFGFIFIAFISIFCIIWLIIRSLLIYLKWYHQIDIKYSSVGLSGLENLDIKHHLFRLRIKYIHFLSLFSIFILRLPIISINDTYLKINSIKKNKVTTKKKQKKD
ncbi:unnamed protein product [Rotaria sordida]|uniref:Uncharacterized protein n=1 Tax=Rotaria sordida TaxID=392033 RepID=A0A819D9A9_9BILA|nr:unnamed protein product [Rotaria sordida]CAF3833596.1 unnamed protein product [Rotaria sordida]